MLSDVPQKSISKIIDSVQTECSIAVARNALLIRLSDFNKITEKIYVAFII